MPISFREILSQNSVYEVENLTFNQALNIYNQMYILQPQFFPFHRILYHFSNCSYDHLSFFIKPNHVVRISNGNGHTTLEPRTTFGYHRNWKPTEFRDCITISFDDLVFEPSYVFIDVLDAIHTLINEYKTQSFAIHFSCPTPKQSADLITTMSIFGAKWGGKTNTILPLSMIKTRATHLTIHSSRQRDESVNIQVFPTPQSERYMVNEWDILGGFNRFLNIEKNLK